MQVPFVSAASAAVKLMSKQRHGHIVSIGSYSALSGPAGQANYAASKAGLTMFTKGLAFDLGPRIRANNICPGTIRTPMTRHLWQDPGYAERASERVALKRLGDPVDVARVALFLTTEESAFTTGTDIPVDGGFCWR